MTLAYGLSGRLSSGLAYSVPAVATFTPASLGSAVKGWWDASDRATLFTDTAMTTLVTAQDQAVAALRDKSASGLHLTQATGANCPLWKSDGSLLFDGTNDTLDNAAITGLPIGTTPSEMFLLVRQDALVADTGTRTAFCYGGSSNNTRRTCFRVVISAANRARAQVGTSASSTSATEITADFSGVNVVHIVFGAASTDIDVNNGTPVNAVVAVNAGAGTIRMGALTSTAASWWNGKMARSLITSLLTTPQRTSTMAYFMAERSRIT